MVFLPPPTPNLNSPTFSFFLISSRPPLLRQNRPPAADTQSRDTAHQPTSRTRYWHTSVHVHVCVSVCVPGAAVAVGPHGVADCDTLKTHVPLSAHRERERKKCGVKI